MTTRATVEDLYEAHGKAELARGELVPLSPTGDLPNRAAGNIYLRLRSYEASAGTGRAYTDNAGFLVNLPHRQSFSPDAAYYVGPRSGGRFLEGAPVFAVEVRNGSENGPAAEREMAEKRSDYFAAGTKVVWDVDVLRDETVRVRVFRASNPADPRIYRRGEVAEAGPALPGFRMAVGDLFE